MRRLLLAFVSILGLAATSAGADTINFETLPDGSLGTDTATVSGVTFIAAEELYNHSSGGFTGRGGSICSLDFSETTCAADMTIKFNGTVRRLRFRSLGYNPGDLATITVYRGKQAKGTFTVDANERIDLSAFHKITRIKIDDSSTGAGFSYGLFRFQRIDPVAKSHPAQKQRHAKKKAANSGN